MANVNDQKRPVALRQADLRPFSPEEIDLINNVVRHFWRMTASQVSDISHQFLGWQLADPRMAAGRGGGDDPLLGGAAFH